MVNSNSLFFSKRSAVAENKNSCIWRILKKLMKMRNWIEMGEYKLNWVNTRTEGVRECGKW